MIKIQPQVWINDIKPRLIKEYGVKIAISYVCRRELGFTVREHRGWVDNPNYRAEMDQYHSTPDSGRNFDWILSEPHKGHSEHMICLDFYDNSSETFFRLKYINT